MVAEAERRGPWDGHAVWRDVIVPTPEHRETKEK